MGQFVTIPFDWDDLPEEERKRIVPIIVHTLDERGYPIPEAWFDQGIAPVYRHLVTIAKWHLGDPWDVSRLVQLTVNTLFERYGTDLGRCPWRRVLREAIWTAQNLSAGGSRADRNRQARHGSIQGMEDTIIDPTD